MDVEYIIVAKGEMTVGLGEEEASKTAKTNDKRLEMRKDAALERAWLHDQAGRREQTSIPDQVTVYVRTKTRAEIRRRKATGD